MDVLAALEQFRAGRLSEGDLLRAIVRHERWWLPLDDAGAPELRSDDTQLFLTAYPEEIEGPCRAVSGRALGASLPRDARGIVLDPGEPHAVALDRARADALTRLAGVIDLEEAITRPAPGQRERLLSSTFYTIARAQAPHQPAVVRDHDLLVVPLFSSEDRLERYLSTEPSLASASRMSGAGERLFADLAAREDFDGILFDPGASVPAVGPSFPATLLSGLDERPGAGVLPSRTVAEIHLWLDLMLAPRDDRRHVIEQRKEGLCAVYTVALPGYGRRRVAFDLAEPTQDPLDLGEGPSRVLCAGLLADSLRTQMLALPDAPARAERQERARATDAARIAWELEKLFGGAPRLPRSAVRTARGARLLRERPEMGEAKLVLASRARAEALAGTV